ncbi:hypothetical protein [Candidatus Ichthyocystis sparus]|uniref:hypothetical protein n=1 Tax=Candidatus Ichthyocystis sparus TaxID=1561004 RepID=UPI000B80E2F6|nr:hypothetical protein [Candidatus Ichthyocystis sparus]
MSDRRIYGASGGDSSSETDEPVTGGTKSPLEAVGQEAKGEAGKSEGKAGGSHGSGASLTSPGGIGSSRELGAKQRVEHEGGKGKHRKKKGDKGDIWHNTARKSAKSLKGRGQLLAAAGATARGEKGVTTPSNITIALRVAGAGPRGKHGPGSDPQHGRRKTNTGGFFSVCELAVIISVCMSFFSVFVYDLLTLEDHDASGTVTGLGIHSLLRFSVPFFTASLLFLIMLIGALSSRDRTT